MRTVIFDLDGTLADTSRDLIEAANSCFRGLGLGDVLDPVADASTAFRGGRAMLTLGFSRVEGFGVDEIDRQYPRLLQSYGENIDVHTVLYPGAMDAVEALKTDGYAVGICTNKPEGLAEELLRRLGVRDAFGSMIGADTLPVRKPDPAPYVAAVERAGGVVAQSCLIGDTVTDRETARAAGVPSVLVTFGPDGDGVKALQPEALLHDYRDLVGVVKELIA
ncbi:HAD-IA family hydrolase [Pseudaestuariivita rosea]|uniref:HAD-IA family hydrolase n=1 Tax=Pseudaestuariivita rosea TaxID=2763263 RepID=UPI001ABB1067|nr:HAD-IA family hydrolase [Pseudaestuariivita rosea]